MRRVTEEVIEPFRLRLMRRLERSRSFAALVPWIALEGRWMALAYLMRHPVRAWRLWRVIIAALRWDSPPAYYKERGR
jgi:hypothetical protein